MTKNIRPPTHVDVYATAKFAPGVDYVVLTSRVSALADEFPDDVMHYVIIAGDNEVVAYASASSTASELLGMVELGLLSGRRVELRGVRKSHAKIDV